MSKNAQSILPLLVLNQKASAALLFNSWLEEAYKEQSNPLQFLKVFPIFDPIRDDARFKDLVRRISLPE